MRKSQIFVKYFLLKMCTSPKSSFFQRLGSRSLTQRRGSATGNTIEKHNGETKRETTEKNEKWKKNIFLFFNLFSCFKILFVYQSKEKMENHRFLWNISFRRWAQVLSHHFFNDWLEDFDPNDGVVQRGMQ